MAPTTSSCSGCDKCLHLKLAAAGLFQIIRLEHVTGCTVNTKEQEGTLKLAANLLGINMKNNQTLDVDQVSSALQTAMASLSGVMSSEVVTASVKRKKAPSTATSTASATAPGKKAQVNPIV